MDKSISYNYAEGAVEASVRSFDSSKLCSTLRRFPVLQVFAAQRLILKLVELKNTDALGAIVSITEMIGCIASPRDSFTAECRICATNLFYSIRDRDENLLRAILKQMIVAKRSCEGCGLFVHTVSSESLKQYGTLASFIADHLNKDETRRCDTDTHFWAQVSDLLERECFLKGGDRIPVSKNLQNTSLLNDETHKLRRLCLRMNGCKKWRKRQSRNARISSDIRKCFDGSHNERVMLLKLATMHAVCPDFVAEKLDAYGLKAYCAIRVRALCDFISSSQWQTLTPEDMLGVKSFANMMSDPPRVQTHSIFKNSLNNELVLSRGKQKELFAAYKPWMPLDAGTRSTIERVLSGEVLMDTILDKWTAAKGNMRPSVDQIVVAVLSDGEAFHKLTTYYLNPWRTGNSSSDANSVSDIQRTSSFRQVNECLRCLEQALTRGVGYPSAFWDQTVQLFQSLTAVVVWALLHDIRGVCKEHVKEAITRSRSVEKRLRDQIEYRRIEPRKDCAVLRVCDCLSVQMNWKHMRRSHLEAWRECRCMVPNTVFVRVPNPSLWFSWVRSMCSAKGDSLSRVVDSHSSMSASLWLYGNPAWRDVQYNYSEREILRCVIDNVLQDVTGALVCGTEDVLAHVLQNREARENIFSEIATSARKMTQNSKHPFGQKTIDAMLRPLRKSIDRLWTLAYQKSRLSKQRHESGMFTRISSTESRSIESLLAIVAPCSSAIHDCIRDMPTLCEYITLIHRYLLSNGENFGETSMHIKIIAGLLSPSVGQKRLSKTDGLPQRESIFDTVMLCFE